MLKIVYLRYIQSSKLLIVISPLSIPANIIPCQNYGIAIGLNEGSIRNILSSTKKWTLENFLFINPFKVYNS